MSTLYKQIFSCFWKSILCGAAYLFSIVIAGAILTMIGGQFPEIQGNMRTLMFFTFVSGSILALLLGPILERTGLSLAKRYFAVVALLFLNSAAQIIEALFFAPTVMSMEVVPTFLCQQTITVMATGLLITVLFKNKESTMEKTMDRKWPWYGWLLRLFLSAGSYAVFYYIFGYISFTFFTGEYYRANINGLAVPQTSVLLTILPIRAILLVISILPLLLNMRVSMRSNMIFMGMALFVISGLIPMLQQIGSLPSAVVIASTVEMLFQNFLCGAVTVIIFTKELPHAEHQIANKQKKEAKGI